MWFKRDFLTNFRTHQCLEAIYLRGPRQIGKSTLLNFLEPLPQTTLYLDDLNTRTQARNDPDFLLSQTQLPVLVDEAHLAPELFFAMKKNIDEGRRKRQKNQSGLPPASFRLTGSNLHDVNTSVQETLAGRVNIFYLHGFSWHEVIQQHPKLLLKDYLFRGGFPELWVRPELNPVNFVNDYISTFIEKDLTRSIGLEKRTEFLSTLRLVAARVGELLNYESIGNDAGVKGKTIKQWLSLLEENKIIYILHPYSSNLNHRLIKMPKAYFMDLAICTRLQSHQSSETILNSPQAGHLFECMVVSEIVKAKDHFRKNWNLYFWRTKEKEEIDLIIEDQSSITLIEIKLGSGSQTEIKIPEAILKTGKKIRCLMVTATGTHRKISPTTECISISDLVEILV